MSLLEKDSGERTRKTTAHAVRQRFRRWMQRVPGPEAQPIVLPQRRVYVLPTMAGLGVALMLAVMLLAAINYNLSLGYAFTFIVAGTGVAHILATWRNLVGLSLSFQADGECFVGEAATFRVTLGSANKHVRHAIQISADDGDPLLRVDTASSDARYDRMEIAALRRGRMHPGRLTIETFFPLGWVRAWSYVEPDASFLVYPQPAGDLPLSSVGSSTGRAQPSALFADEEFAGLRDYRSSDSPSRIAWRRAARNGALLVKQFDALDSEDWLLSWSHLPAALDTEARLSQLTQWLLLARAANARVTLEIPGARLGPDHGDAHYQACLAHLALFEMGEA